MNNPRSLFVLFLFGLAGVGLLVSWWFGPTLVGIVLDGEERAAPFLVLALAERDEETGFGVSAAEVPEATTLLWRSDQPMLALGPSLPGWQRVELWQFATGGSFVRFATGGGVREAFGAGGRALYGVSLANTTDAAAVAASLAYPVLFGARRDPARMESLEQVLAPVLPRGAERLWQLEVATLAGPDRYDQWMLVSFPTEAQRLAWLWGNDEQVALELARQSFDQLSVWELGGLSR